MNIYFIALQSLIIRKRWFIFQLWISISLIPYSAGAKVPFDHENVYVCSFSNTYCNNYFCPFLFLFWVLLLNGLGLEEQITSFQWHFPFRILKGSLEIWPLVPPTPPFISRIKYPVTSTGGEGVDLWVAGHDPAWESVVASWSRYCSYLFPRTLPRKSN